MPALSGCSLLGICTHGIFEILLVIQIPLFMLSCQKTASPPDNPVTPPVLPLGHSLASGTHQNKSHKTPFPFPVQPESSRNPTRIPNRDTSIPLYSGSKCPCHILRLSGLVRSAFRPLPTQTFFRQGSLSSAYGYIPILPCL